GRAVAGLAAGARRLHPRTVPGAGVSSGPGGLAVDEQWSAGGACGWQFTGNQDEAVAAVMDHAGRVHNMTTTREEVLPSLVRVGDAPPAAASDGSPSGPPRA